MKEIIRHGEGKCFNEFANTTADFIFPRSTLSLWRVEINSAADSERGKRAIVVFTHGGGLWGVGRGSFQREVTPAGDGRPERRGADATSEMKSEPFRFSAETKQTSAKSEHAERRARQGGRAAAAARPAGGSDEGEGVSDDG